MFYEQLLKLCEINNISPTSLVQKLGMSKGTMSNWKKGGVPNGDAVVRFAKHFGVSTDYLLRGDEFSPDLSTDDKELLDLFHLLPHDAQIEFKGELRGYLKALQKSKPSVAAEEPLRRASGN